MKKIISFLIILLPTLTSVWAVSYTAVFQLTCGSSFSFIKDDEDVRTRFYLSSEIEPVGISFGRHTITLPIVGTYYSESIESNYYLLHSNADIGLGLSYRFDCTSLLSLRAKGLVSYRIYPKIKATAAVFSGGIAFEFHPSKGIAITIPLDVHYLKDEIELNAGFGCTIFVGGER